MRRRAVVSARVTGRIAASRGRDAGRGGMAIGDAGALIGCSARICDCISGCAACIAVASPPVDVTAPVKASLEVGGGAYFGVLAVKKERIEDCAAGALLEGSDMVPERRVI